MVDNIEHLFYDKTGTNVRYYGKRGDFVSTVKDALSIYKDLSFGDRLIFYLTLSSDIDIQKDTLPEILEEARPSISSECYYCHSSRIVRNGHRRDGTQRYLCRDCRKTFTCKTDTFLSGSHNPNERSPSHIR